ncbi:MAG: heavy metal-binding domain-containing protein, partial [Thermoanaerobaculia bacterium]
MSLRTSHAKGLSRALLWIAVGFVFFYLLFFDPWGLHPVDSWLQARLGYHTGEMEMSHSTEEEQLWTCPMHPHILEDVPGECPICGMDLVPAAGQTGTGNEKQRQTTGSEREILFYRNPMDPTITSPIPAKDEMGMDYVPVYA